MIMADQIKVYWDACAWLGMLNGETGRAQALEHVWGRAKRGDIVIWTSAFCIAEVYRVRCEDEWAMLSDENDEAINNLFDQPFVETVQIDTVVAKLAKKLLRTHEKLKKPSDAVHLATAIHWDLDQFHTYDGSDLLHLDGKIQTSNGSPMSICKPDMIDGENLFTIAAEQEQDG
jgi:predicted nucleic acid-binding protein